MTDPLPDESQSQALVRVERQQLAKATPVGEVMLDVFDQHLRVPVSAADQLHGELFIAFYNKSGQMPQKEDFAPAAAWPEDVRAQMGLPPRRQLLPAIGETGTPFRVVERCGLAPLYRKPRGHDQYSARATITTSSYVTHFVIGTRADGVVLGGELHQAVPIIAGADLKFGLRLPPALVQRLPPQRLQLPEADVPMSMMRAVHEIHQTYAHLQHRAGMMIEATNKLSHALKDLSKKGMLRDPKKERRRIRYRRRYVRRGLKKLSKRSRRP